MVYIDKKFLNMCLAGLASVLAGGFTHPIDTVKIRLQKEGESSITQKKLKNVFIGTKVIYQEEGPRALFKGLQMSLAREASYSTLRLGLYEPFTVLLFINSNHIKNKLESLTKRPANILTKFTAGLLSGSTGSLISNPFDLLKVRLQALKGEHTLSKVAVDVFRKEGILGFYKGSFPNISRGAILTGVKMATYDSTKRFLKRIFNLQEGFFLHLYGAFVTGLTLTVTTAPLDLIKTRIMSQEVGKQVYKGLLDCAIKTIKNEGIFAFYKGFLPQWFRFGPFNIIQLIIWEKLRTLCGMRNI